MHKVFPHMKNGGEQSPMPPALAERQPQPTAKKMERSPPPLPRSYRLRHKIDLVRRKVHARTIKAALTSELRARTDVPRTLQHWVSQIEEFAHRFIARRDSNATIEAIGALETLARDYAELRKKSITLHIDAKFLLSGPQSDISDVLNPVYESVLHIIDDAIASKNERIVQHSLDSMGRMASHAMSIVAVIRDHYRSLCEIDYIHEDMEVLARAADFGDCARLASDIRSWMTLPDGLSPERKEHYLDARQNRLRHLNEAFARAGRRMYARNDPVERLYEFVNKPEQKG